MLNQLYMPGINLTYSFCVNPLMCTRIHFANILLTIYGSIFIRNGGQSFSFPVFLSDIDIKLMLTSQNQSGSVLFFNLLEKFEKDCC